VGPDASQLVSMWGRRRNARRLIPTESASRVRGRAWGRRVVWLPGGRPLGCTAIPGSAHPRKRLRVHMFMGTRLPIRPHPPVCQDSSNGT